MKRTFALLIFMMIPIMMISSFTVDDFDGVIDFSITLKELNKLDDLESIAGRYVIISGEVSTRQVIDQNEETFVAELEIVDGEWQGAEEILIYRCIVVLDGPDFFGAVPARRSRTQDPREIGLNTSILVVAQVLGFAEMPDQTYVPVVQAVYLRRMS